MSQYAPGESRDVGDDGDQRDPPLRIYTPQLPGNIPTMSTITPCAISETDTAGWNSTAPFSLRFAQLWFKHGVRGKAAVPHTIGRSVARSMRTVIRTEHGAVMAVYPGSLDTYCSISAQGGTFGREVVNTCHGLLRAGETAFDVGANVGLVSLELCSRFAGRVRVVSFEPLPQLAKHLAISAELNDFDIRVFNCLVGDQNGEQILFVPSHSVHASVISRSGRAKRMVRPVVRLDDLVFDGTVEPPAMMKVDVEGAEMSVLTGAQRLLHEYQPSLVFEADANMQRFGMSRRDLFAELRRHAPYRIFAVAGTELMPIDETDDPDRLPQSDYAAVAPRYLDRVSST
jgi:FkbM family methyltransferase